MDVLARQHWIFDMDGTLTLAVHDFEAIRRSLGLPSGRPILEEIEKLSPGRAAGVRHRLDELELELARRATPQPGAVPFVRRLRERGVRVGVLTRNSRRNAMVTLGAIGLLECFDETEVLGRDEAPPKPDPGGVTALLAHWNAHASDALIVGDFRFDLDAGRAAGTATMYFDPSGEFPFAPLADRCFAGWDELTVP